MIINFVNHPTYLYDLTINFISFQYFCQLQTVVLITLVYWLSGTDGEKTCVLQIPHISENWNRKSNKNIPN